MLRRRDSYHTDGTEDDFVSPIRTSLLWSPFHHRYLLLLAYGGLSRNRAVTYLNIDSLSTQSPHLTPRNPQSLCIWYACKHIPCLSIDDRVITARFHGNGRVARNLCELCPQFGWEKLFEAVKGPMDGHCPLIAPVIELHLLLYNGVGDSRLGANCVSCDTSDEDGGLTAVDQTNLLETLSKHKTSNA